MAESLGRLPLVEVGGGATTETPKRRIDAQPDATPIHRGFWQSVGWGGVGSGLVFAVVGAILVYIGCNGFQLYAFSRKNLSQWEKKKVDTWRSAGFDTSGIDPDQEYVLDLPRSDFDFEHSDNYKYARLVQWYDYENADTLVGACGLASLIELELQNNALASLPESFGGLAILEYLDLNDNALTSLPESFGDLASLAELYLNNNALASLPESFGDLERLDTLDLRNNANLSSLPASSLELSHLEPVSLAGTAICANGGAPALDSAFDDVIEAGVVYCEGACAPTCYGYTCHYLSSEFEVSCAELETYDCDCSGCSCPLDSTFYSYSYSYSY